MNLKFKKWVYVCLTFLSFITIKSSHAQTYCTTTLTPNCELVCNGGFETTTANPTGYNQLSLATGWGTASLYNTPDLFSANSNTASSVSVPCNKEGYQNAHSGFNYAGLLLNGYLNAGNPYGWYENMKTNLSDYLVIGKMYDVSLWVSAADLGIVKNQNLLIDIGPDFTYTVSPSLLNDKNNWVLISFPYCDVTGSANYIVIRSVQNFTPTSVASQTTASCGFNGSTASYIYIDDVSIKESKFSVPNVTGCLNTALTLSVTSECAVNTANYTYIWSYGDGSTSVNTGTVASAVHSYTNFGTYTGSVSVNTGSCSKTYTYNVNIPVTTIAITTNTNTICNSNTSFTATPNPAGTYTSSWSMTDAATGTVIPTSSYTVTGGASLTPTINFANINQNVYVMVTVTSTLGCQYTNSLFMPSCCATPTNIVKYTNTTYNTLTSLTGTAIAMAGTITVNSGGHLLISSKDVTMDPNTKIVLNGTGRITLTNDYIHGCNYMWDGIYANTTGLVSAQSVRFEDAKRVIVDSLGTASLNIITSYFNKNNMGIVIKAAKTSTSTVAIRNNLFTCSDISTAGAVPKIPTAVNLTNAPTLGAFTSTVMLPPYNTQKSMCGIYFINASHTGKITNGIVTNVITIGGTTGQENVFDKMQLGIYSYDSKSNIQNNVFQNIKSTIAPSGVPNSGILLIGPIFGAGNGSYMNVGGSLALKNTFRNNDNGLYNVSKSAVLATYNTFSVQTTGVYVSGNNNGSSVGVNFNNFYQNGIAVNFYNNTFLTGSIKNNNMNNTASAVGTYADNFAIRCTEAALATSTVSFPAFDIDNNNISGYYNGIYAVNTLSLIAVDNEVHMREDNAFEHWQSGICVTGSNANRVNNNIVDMTTLNIGSWAYWQSGIFMTLNQVPRVQCNSINNLFHSITFKQNNSTAAADGVKGNYMQNAQNGIWMHDNAVIGNQAGSSGTNSSDNVWNIPNAGAWYTYMQGNSNPSSHIFFTRSLGSGYDLPSAKAGQDNSTSPYMFGNNNSAASTGSCNLNTATPSNQKVAGSGLSGIMQGADDILTDFDNEQNNGLSMANVSANAAVNGADNAVSLKAMNRRHLLYNMLLQNIDVQQDAALSGFMNSIKSHNTGLLLAVDSLIHQAEIKSALVSVAQNANTAIVPTNLVEQGQQEFNALYLEYLAQNKTLNPSQLSSMVSLAQQCPSYYGISVYQARTVLFDMTKQTYRNSCANVSPPLSSQRMAQSTDNEAQATDVSIYPNPAHNQLFVDADGYSTVNLKLYNIMGELVMEKSVANESSIDISSLSSGIYTFKVFSSDNELKVGKLIITH